jgi:hypothetical protein
MEIGESAVAVIAAREPWNDARIRLIAGERYQFRAKGKWVDWFVTCDADGYDSLNWIMTLCEPLRRSPRDRWFVLMGSLGRGTGKLFRIGRIRPPRRIRQPISSASPTTARWPTGTTGRVELTVTRIG